MIENKSLIFQREISKSQRSDTTNMDFFFPVSLCVPQEAAEAPECDRGTQGKSLSHLSPANHVVSGVPVVVVVTLTCAPCHTH